MKSLMVIAAALLGAAANAQYWKAVGLGTVGPTEVQCLYGDSVSDRLLAGGTFMWIMNEDDTVLGMGQAAWNGTRWDSLATRIQPISGNNSTQQTFWFLRFQGALYACGGFALQLSNGEWTNNLARLDEESEHWESLGCNIPSTSGILTLVPKEPDTTLYATGYLGYDDEFCGFPPSCVFRYDGSAFHIWEPFNQIPYDADNYVGTVFDFQGKTYMSCSLPDPDGSGFVSFIRWNGSSWEHVPGWNTLSPIKEILIHDDTLYVAGTFSLADGGPGNGVAAFDGENWSDMGSGLHYLNESGFALDLEWFQGELWACGLFDHVGDVPANSIAHWDGHSWCVPPGVFRQSNYNYLSTLEDMAVWRDSLYVCGSIAYVDWQPIRQVAQWIGGDAVEDCSTVGIHEESVQRGQLTAIPLPGGSRWSVHFPHAGNWVLDTYDAMGRRIRRMQKAGDALELDLTAESPGMYVLRASATDGASCQTKLLNP